MSGSNEDLKPAAHRLAELLSTEEGARIVALMRHLGLLTPISAPPPPPRAPRTVGIWRADAGADTFVRDASVDDASLWADVERIAPKGARKRVAFLGESVARGYFHDPEYTPANALEAMLRSAPGVGDVEVVDLARADILYRPLLQLAESAALLEPDVLVVFAGNNWLPVVNATRDRVELSLVLRDGSLLDVRAYLEERLAALASLYVRTLADISVRTGVPVVIVVPEFNLVDWRSDLEQTPPFLGDDDRRRWLSLHEEAVRAEAAHDDARVEELGRAMHALDGGTSAVGPSLVARALLRAGRREEARTFFERARDARLWFTYYETPRCHAEVQRVLREEGAAHGLRVVDLPAALSAARGGALPDRSLFLDYCHLTAEGIQLAMAAVAESVAPLLGATETAAAAFARNDATPSSWVRAQASLLAACHNTRWGQRKDVLEHHAAEAVRHDPAIARVMLDVIDFGTRRGWRGLTRSFDRMQAASVRALTRYFASAERATGQSSFELVDVLANTARAADPEVLAKVHELRQREHGVEASEVDLLRSPYVERTGFRQRFGWGEFAGHCQMTERDGTFFFVASGKSAVRLALTYRVPGEDGGESVSVTINGEQLASLPAPSAWRATTLTVPASQLVDGVNELVIRWPESRIASADALLELADDLELGETPDAHPVLGEVHVLRASGAED